MDTKIYYIEGREGNSFAIGNIRIAGAKPWGGGRILAERKTTVKDILYALNNIYCPSHQPLRTIEDEAKALIHNQKFHLTENAGDLHVIFSWTMNINEDKMKLDPDKFIKNEKFSNHAVQGYSHPDCPINKGCFAQATGFGGGIVSLCDKFNKKTCECSEIVNNSIERIV